MPTAHRYMYMLFPSNCVFVYFKKFLRGLRWIMTLGSFSTKFHFGCRLLCLCPFPRTDSTMCVYTGVSSNCKRLQLTIRLSIIPVQRTDSFALSIKGHQQTEGICTTEKTTKLESNGETGSKYLNRHVCNKAHQRSNLVVQLLKSSKRYPRYKVIQQTVFYGIDRSISP